MKKIVAIIVLLVSCMNLVSCKTINPVYNKLIENTIAYYNETTKDDSIDRNTSDFRIVEALDRKEEVYVVFVERRPNEDRYRLNDFVFVYQKNKLDDKQPSSWKWRENNVIYSDIFSNPDFKANEVYTEFNTFKK